MLSAVVGRLLLSKAATGVSSANSNLPKLSFDIKMDDAALRRKLTNAPKQVKFATAFALTKTAQDVQTAEVKEAQRAFKVRSLWWKKNRKHGIKVKPAVKSRLKSTVHTSAYWLVDHVDGATRYPQGQHRAVPKSPRIKRKKSGQVSKTWMPAGVKNKFVIESGDKTLLFSYNKRTKTKELMYLLIPRARIKRTFKWYKVGVRTANKTWGRNINRAVKVALETAK